MSLTPVEELALELAEGQASSATNLTRVAKATSPEAAAWAFQQWELRARAKGKFAQAAKMLFGREALEQATHEAVARYHASLFPRDTTVADLTTGIGADLMALAERGPVIGFELDSGRARYALHNLAVSGGKGEVRVEDSLAWLSAVPNVDYAFADPARRIEGRRTLDLSEFQPDPFELGTAMIKLKLGAIKLSPLLRDEDLLKLGTAVRFVSYRGECRESLILLGSEAPVGVAAVLAESGDELSEGGFVASETTPLVYVFDADAAAVRAHALGNLAGPMDLRALGDVPGYLTGPEFHSSPWLRSYRTLSTGAYDPKRLKSALVELGAKTPVFKQRGTKLDLIALEKQFRLSGQCSLVVIFYLVGKSVRFVVAEPCVE